MATPTTQPIQSALAVGRPRVLGKFLYTGARKLPVRGVTYGTFRPDDSGMEFHDRVRVEQDFAQMSRHGINSVRTYTVPPRWLLDLAARYGLYVMIGLPWEQHITFLDDPKTASDIIARVAGGVRACAGHPAVLAYAIGNEIPSPIVRWYGHKRIERFLRRLYEAGKQTYPEALLTYVNYPTTEYLELPFLDIACFNVYLEAQDRLDAYLARLHNLAGTRPLLLAEVGLDSRRHGEDQQARTMQWQIESTFASGCAGLFVYAWTDEWHRGGQDILDWDFGLTARDRRPKPALAAVSDSFSAIPFPARIRWPRVSVVVCSYNGSRTIGQTLSHLRDLDYPDYEVIVINDGSRDDTAAIAELHGARVITVANGGLSRARNLGMEAATGEIVAYIDDDAYPDPDWLKYLAWRFLVSDHAAVGGPNLAPAEDGPVAACIARAPGGPNHVLLTDTEAEHIPGCNMAFRTERLREVGGFDTQFRVAGDDVDLCWRLTERGLTIGFHSAAVVWHHRRGSIRAYLKQQAGYGAAEALLARKWPRKYNKLGHLSWGGRIYAGGVPFPPGWTRPLIYQGTWGQAAFQRLYQPAGGILESLCQTPEWYLAVFLGLLAGLLGVFWTPLLFVGALAALAVLGRVLQVVLAVGRMRSAGDWKDMGAGFWLLTGLLHLAQPVARLWGRLRYGLTPWRLEGLGTFSLPWGRVISMWSEHWRPAQEWLSSAEARLRARVASVSRGGGFDAWDLEIRQGFWAGVRLQFGIEEHGDGRQLLRFRLRPRFSGVMAGVTLGTAAAAVFAAVAGDLMSILSGLGALLPAALIAQDCAAAFRAAREALDSFAAAHGLVPLPSKPLSARTEPELHRLAKGA